MRSQFFILNLFGFIVHGGNLSQGLMGKIMYFLSGGGMKGGLSGGVSGLCGLVYLFLNFEFTVDFDRLVPNTVFFIHLLHIGRQGREIASETGGKMVFGIVFESFGHHLILKDVTVRQDLCHNTTLGFRLLALFLCPIRFFLGYATFEIMADGDVRLIDQG